MECDKVKYHWNTLSVNWEAEEGKVLLPMIIQLWVATRGFTYVSACVEQYKQMHSKVYSQQKAFIIR